MFRLNAATSASKRTRVDHPRQFMEFSVAVFASLICRQMSAALPGGKEDFKIEVRQRQFKLKQDG